MSLDLSKSDRLVISGDDYGNIKLWDLQNTFRNKTIG